MRSDHVILPAIAFVLASHVEQAAYAYVDPASGSILLQLILGGIAGVAVVIKLYWQRCKERIATLFRVRL
jgi:hypothetical protein